MEMDNYEIQLKLYSAKKDVHAIEVAYFDALKRLHENKKRVEELTLSLKEIESKRSEALERAEVLEMELS